MKVGEHWAYQAPQKPLTSVTVLVMNQGKPLRTKIEFDEDRFGGRQEWVPPARLRVPWSQAEKYLEREAAWARLREPSSAMTQEEDLAIEYVFRTFVPMEVASPVYSNPDQGILSVGNWASLESLAGQSRDEFADALSIEENGEEFLPWPVLRSVAESITNKNARTVLLHIEKEEEIGIRESAHGKLWRGQGGAKDYYQDPESCADSFETIRAPALAVLRGWCGADLLMERDQIKELRRKLATTTSLLNDAIDELVSHDQIDAAWRIHRALYPQVKKSRWRSVRDVTREMERDRKAAEEAAWKAGAEVRFAIRRRVEAQSARELAAALGEAPPIWATYED